MAADTDLEDAIRLLMECRDQFALYVRSHAAKETADGYRKAATNQAFVEKLTAFLSRIEPPRDGCGAGEIDFLVLPRVCSEIDGA